MNPTNWWSVLVECSGPFSAFILCVLLFRLWDVEKKVDLLGKVMAATHVNIAVSKMDKDGVLKKIFEGEMPLEKETDTDGKRPDGDA